MYDPAQGCGGRRCMDRFLLARDVQSITDRGMSTESTGGPWRDRAGPADAARESWRSCRMRPLPTQAVCKRKDAPGSVRKRRCCRLRWHAGNASGLRGAAGQWLGWTERRAGSISSSVGRSARRSLIRQSHGLRRAAVLCSAAESGNFIASDLSLQYGVPARAIPGEAPALHNACPREHLSGGIQTDDVLSGRFLALCAVFEGGRTWCR